MDAPEKIWAWLFIDTKRSEEMQGGWDDKPDRKTTEYLRSDVAQAMVAAAYEDAAQIYDRTFDSFAKLIRKQTPTDARAALDALLKAEREKALREAAGICDNAPAKPNQAGENKEVESAHWCAAMIRALIDKDKADG